MQALSEIPTSGAHVFLVDDDAHASTSLQRAFERRSAPFTMHLETSRDLALDRAQALRPEVIVLDLSLEAGSGPEQGLLLIRDLLEIDITTRILVLTGHGSGTIGVRAIESGAASFVLKPAEPNHLYALILDAILCSRLKREHLRLQSELKTAYLLGVSGNAPSMKRALEEAAYAASHAQPVLIAGETGTGKGIFARAIFQAQRRHAKTFLRFQPAFGSHDLIASELFGHRKGAFTGAITDQRGLVEEAHEGTLFIDEVDELPHETQILLLNVLQEKTFRRIGTTKLLRSDFRLLTATNRSLDDIREKKILRQDFYHRVAHCIIEIPPLRERREDIRELAENFLIELVTREKLSVQGIMPDALQKLERYQWPGNVRELLAAVEGGAHRANYERSRFVKTTHLALDRKEAVDPETGLAFRKKVRLFERQLVDQALAVCGNNQTRAAETLQIDRSVLRRILDRA